MPAIDESSDVGTAVEMTTHSGYECPKGTSKKARKVLRRLRKKGTAIFEHDDGSGLGVRQELESIAGLIGLEIFTSQYRVVLVETEQHKIVKG